MTLNPEFVRNLWLEFKGHRVVAVPVALAAVFVLAVLADTKLRPIAGSSATFAGEGGFILIVILWGSRMAAETVPQEIAARTWDGQRMSAIGPWPMVWGKLLGSTSFAWFCGFICLGFLAAMAAPLKGVDDVVWSLVVLVLAGVVAHVVALLASLIALQRGRTPGRSQVTLFQLLGIGFGLTVTTITGGEELLQWFVQIFPATWFLLTSAVIFCVWFLIGAYQLMRRELQMSCGPLPWLVFVLFVMAYTAGFAPEIRSHAPESASMAARHLFVALVAGAGLLYLVALVEPKNIAVLRKMRAHAGAREWRGMFPTIPRAFLTLPLVGAVALATVVADFMNPGSLRDGVAVVVAAVFFLNLRDVALIYVVNLARPSPRADMLVLLYLALIYVVLPAILGVLDLDALILLFRPDGLETIWYAAAAAAVEAAVMTAIAARLFLRATAPPTGTAGDA